MPTQPILDHLWIIPLLPLLGSAINGLLGGKWTKTIVNWVALGATGLSFVSALEAVREYFASGQVPVHNHYFDWISAGKFTAGFDLQLDQLTVVMLLVVTGVGFLIHIYSTGYMAHEGGYYRFFSYLNLFMFFMLILVLAANYVLLFVGWEGVGLCSYLLIGFYFLKKSASDAGKKAFIVNRIGDFGFLIALFLMIKHFGTLDFERVFDAVKPYSPETAGVGFLTAIALLLMLGACGKSAQIPLYVWLPDAMEGPTPVSALIHAATMVTAGVYMVARSHVIFERAPSALMVVAIIGTLTAFFAATIGIAQTDIKKVLAYSTVSQLGYMFMACGVAAYSAGIFHLMTHAFFKGLLFLAAGSVIHAVGGEQDMRKMGGLRQYIPWTFMTMTAATFAITGFPPFAGFFSKDEILARAYEANPAYWFIGVTTAFITSFYMFRLWFMTFFGDYRGREAAEHGHAPAHGHGHGGHGDPHESPMIMLVPLMILAVLSVIGGWVGIGGRFEHFLSPVFGEGVTAVATEALSRSTEITLMVISVAAAVLGFYLAYVLYLKRPELPQKIADSLGGLYQAVVNKYYVDEIYADLFVKPLVDGSTRILWHGVDQGVIDAAINDTADGARHVSDSARQMQSGNVRSYAGWVAVGGAVIIAYMIWMGVR